jgi:hypothetical protein
MAGFVAVACSSVTEVKPRDERRLELNDLTAPTTVVSGQPLVVDIRYGIGGCEEVTAVSGQLSAANRLEVEVRGRFIPPPQGAGCIDVLYHRDTSLTVIAPHPGVLAVVGLQPAGGGPIERSVTVSSPN